MREVKKEIVSRLQSDFEMRQEKDIQSYKQDVSAFIYLLGLIRTIVQKA
jgi:hypothetical protein